MTPAVAEPCTDLRIEVIERPDALRDRIAAWRALESVALDPLPFAGVDWLMTWIDSFRPERLFVVVAEREGRLDGLLPLQRERRSIGPIEVDTLCWLANGVTPRMAPLVRSIPVGRALFDFLRFECGGFDMMLLENTVGSAVVPTAAESSGGFRSDGWSVRVCGGKSSPYCDTRRSHAEMTRGWSANLRSNHRRAHRKLADAGAVELRRLEGVQIDAAALQAFDQVVAASWKGGFSADARRDAAQRRFYAALSGVTGPALRPCLWLLTLDGEPVAVQYHVIADRRAYLLRTDFVQSLSERSPGTALMDSVLAGYCESPDIDCFDLCGMDYAYKLRFADGVTRMTSFELFPGTPRARLLRAAKWMKARVESLRLRRHDEQ